MRCQTGFLSLQQCGRALVNRFQNSCDRKIIFELNRDLLVSESFEYGEDELDRCRSVIVVNGCIIELEVQTIGGFPGNVKA